jgi:ribosomal protein S18 acetylase RimI-like enzyme
LGSKQEAMHIRTAALEDVPLIRDLYRDVARQGAGLARTEEEMTEDYVKDFVTRSLSSGLILVAEHPENADALIGEIHAYRPGPSVFNHVLSGLTIAVRPDFQGRKIGRTLFTIFLEQVGINRPDIGKVELIARESNIKAIRFYQSFGFLIEGRMEMRIRTPDGNYEADIPMGWQNPNFEF